MLTKSQEEALKLIERWIQSGGTLFRLGGPAGSGKSYLIPIVADIVGREKCLFMTPTGKAANNLQKAGLQAQTIHSTIYRVRDEGDDEDIDDENFVSEYKNGAADTEDIGLEETTTPEPEVTAEPTPSPAG